MLAIYSQWLIQGNLGESGGGLGQPHFLLQQRVGYVDLVLGKHQVVAATHQRPTVE